MKITLSIIVLFFLLGSCTKVVELNGIDKIKFKSDNYGCKGYRASVKAELELQLTKFNQLSEGEITSNLGMPDNKVLANRSQKFFKYYMNGNAKCKAEGSNTNLVLLIRFNSLNRVSEANITVEN
jgi:hypothetical protein